MIKWADWQDVLAAVIQPNSGITRCVFFGRRCCGFRTMSTPRVCCLRNGSTNRSALAMGPRDR